jgi:hypothetical protein
MQGPFVQPRSLGCSACRAPWLYDAAKAGRIPSVRIGGPDGPLRVVAEDLAGWLDEARAAWRPGDSSVATLRRAAADSSDELRAAPDHGLRGRRRPTQKRGLEVPVEALSCVMDA